MAPADPPDSQPAALEGAVSFDRVLTVLGATWKVAAGRAGAIVRRYKLAIKADQSQDKPFRDHA